MATQQNQNSKTELLFMNETEGDPRILSDQATGPIETDSQTDPADHKMDGPSHSPSNSKSNGAAEGMERLCAASLGARLKEARRKRNLSVGDVAKTLNFKNKIVRSIESGDLRQLPTSYEVGFFRTYAQYVGAPCLGIPIDDAVGVIRDEFKPEPTTTIDPMAIMDDLPSIGSTLLKIALGIILIAGIVAWFAWPQGQAQQTSMLNADDVPIQYTYNLHNDK